MVHVASFICLQPDGPGLWQKGIYPNMPQLRLKSGYIGDYKGIR